MEINLEDLNSLNLQCKRFLDNSLFELNVEIEELKDINNKYIKFEGIEQQFMFDNPIEYDYFKFKQVFSYVFKIVFEIINNSDEITNLNYVDISQFESNLLFELKNSYLRYRKAMQRDIIRDNIHKIINVIKDESLHDMSEFSTNNKRIIYLDNNIISYIEQDPDIFNKLLGFKNSIQFVYSPINIEEIIKRTKSNHENTIKLLNRLTNGIGVFKNNNKIKLYKENPKYSYKRIKVIGSDINSALEEYRELTRLDNTTESNNYNSEKHRVYINGNDNILKNNKCREILNHGLSKYSNNTLEEYENMCKNDLEDYDKLNSSIYALMNALMFIGYKTDKKGAKNTVRSGVYDIEHLIFATKANFFLTNDKKLASRVKVIFEILNITTNIIMCDNNTIISEIYNIVNN